jgi:transposase
VGVDNFRPYDQSQGAFRAIIPNELLEPEHPARIVDKVVELLDLSSIYGWYQDEGSQPYHPKMMLKVLFYSYLTGTMSSRKMWEGLKNRADYIYLSGDQIPDFRTLNRFRSRHLEQLPGLFAQIVHLCTKLGMIDFKYLAIDGQKIQADASWRRSKTKKRLEKSMARVTEGMRKLLEKEVSEDFSQQTKQERLAELARQEKQLLALKGVLDRIEDEKANINMTDPEAKVMRHKDGRSLPSYNHQSAVDGTYGVTCSVKTEDRCDGEMDLLELVDQAKENTGQVHEKVMADSAFGGYEVLEKLEQEQRPEEFFVPDARFAGAQKGEGEKGKFDGGRFERREDGTVICPAGRLMLLKGERLEESHTVRTYAGTACEGCPLRESCTEAKQRTLNVDSREPLREAMREKLRTDRGRETYMKRQGIVEGVHGNDQRNKGWRQHLLRGKGKAALEFMLVRIGSNLSKIATYRPRELLALG